MTDKKKSDSDNLAKKEEESSASGGMRERVEGWNELASFLYKISIAVGVLITFAYLFSIDFFPSSLSPGDVVFFVFVAIAFGFLYIVSLIYGLYSSIWVVQVIRYVVGLLKFKRMPLRQGNLFALRHVIKKKGRCAGKPGSILRRVYTGWLRVRVDITRAVASGRATLPSFASGGATATMSAMVFAAMLLTALSVQSHDLNRFLTGFFLAGFVSLNIFSTPSSPPQGKAISSVQRVLLILVLPLFIVVMFGEPKSLLHAAFRGLGVRSENVSIEVSDSERAMFDRISETVGRPLIDCRKENNGKLLVHNVSVVWGGIGGQTLLAIAPYGDLDGSEKEKYNEKQAKLVKVAIESSAIKVIRSQAALDSCYEVKADTFFASGKYDLTSHAKEQLIDLARAIKSQSTPKEIKVIGYSDPRPISGRLAKQIPDNQYLSEMRAKSVGEVIRGQIPNAMLFTDGAGAGQG